MLGRRAFVNDFRVPTRGGEEGGLFLSKLFCVRVLSRESFALFHNNERCCGWVEQVSVAANDFFSVKRINKVGMEMRMRALSPESPNVEKVNILGSYAT